MSVAKIGKSDSSTLYFTDLFNEDLRPGRVIGSQNSAGVVRGGIDSERVISSDHGAMRIQPLLRPGWGKSGLAYGPYQRENGLAFGVYLLNGHNTSQLGDLAQSLPGRLQRWLLGSETFSIPRRMAAWVRSGQKKRFVRQWRRWIWLNRHYRHIGDGLLDENLAVGWFPSEVPQSPVDNGNAYVVHATGPENGELWVRTAGKPLPVLRGLQNVPVYYVVILRENGAAYYAASLPNVRGLAAFPMMRPMGVDAFCDDSPVYAGVYQSVLGQIGFQVDTRVYGTAVQKIDAWDSWYGTAHLADRLVGNGRLTGSAAEKGGVWTAYKGDFERSPDGARALETENLAILDAGELAGLIHAIVVTSTDEEVSLIWRFLDEANYWSLVLRQKTCQLRLKLQGDWIDVANDPDGLQLGAVNSVQILDDGEYFAAYVNGRLLFGSGFTESRLQTATGVGIGMNSGDGVRVRSLEAHPRAVQIPAELAFAKPWLPSETAVAIADDFIGETKDLAEHKVTVGEQTWRKSFGRGAIQLTGDSAARVVATPESPNPGRTIYTLAWSDPSFAELDVEITPPGSNRGDGQHGRGGLVFWQDQTNQLIINTWLDDSYEGASISSFFYLNGFEEVFDAVWTNVGKRIHWGQPYHLRVAFDGVRYLAYVNNEPVLYRALTDVYPNFNRLSIQRVGIVANWEWGNDTGSVFRQFRAGRKE